WSWRLERPLQPAGADPGRCEAQGQGGELPREQGASRTDEPQRGSGRHPALADGGHDALIEDEAAGPPAPPPPHAPPTPPPPPLPRDSLARNSRSRRLLSWNARASLVLQGRCISCVRHLLACPVSGTGGAKDSHRSSVPTRRRGGATIPAGVCAGSSGATRCG